MPFEKLPFGSLNAVQSLSSKAPASSLGKAGPRWRTGTGKTYCYIKTIFELNKKYG
jgi:hypothetical protein